MQLCVTQSLKKGKRREKERERERERERSERKKAEHSKDCMYVSLKLYQTIIEL